MRNRLKNIAPSRAAAVLALIAVLAARALAAETSALVVDDVEAGYGAARGVRDRATLWMRAGEIAARSGALAESRAPFDAAAALLTAEKAFQEGALTRLRQCTALAQKRNSDASGICAEALRLEARHGG